MFETKKLILIDGTALAYRSFYAFIRNPLINSKGEDTSAPFGFTRALLELKRAHQPDYLAVAMDPGGKTFRHEKFPEYKATRERMPEEMRAQLSRIREVLDALQVPVVERKGFEADDVIGTLATSGADAGLDVVILTGDKDFMQLVGPQIKLLSLRGRGGEDADLIDESGVQDRFGVSPNQVIEVLGLMGDTSDNVPGVPKVGEKTARSLIQEHGDLESVLKAAVEGPQKKVVEKNLVEFADQARLSRELVIIQTDVQMDLDLDALKVQPPNGGKVVELFKELEFRFKIEGLSDESGQAEPEANYSTVGDLQELVDLIDEIRDSGKLVVEVEATSTNPMLAEIVGISLTDRADRVFYVPMRHKEGPNLDPALTLDILRPIFEDPNIAKVGHDIKLGAVALSHAGIRVQGFRFDTMLASYLINPSGREHGLADIALAHLNCTLSPRSDLVGSGRSKIEFSEVPVDKAMDYSCEKVNLIMRLHEVLAPKLDEQDLSTLFHDVEMPLSEVLTQMEFAGVSVDVPFLEQMSSELHGTIDGMVSEIYELAGETFNVNSTRQLAEILFEKLGLPHGRKTKTGYSTDQSVLERLAEQHPLPARLLDYRVLMKLQSTYVDALPRLVHSETGRIHASFNQAVAATGRLSVSDPNLQNIPIRTELGRQIRRGFVPAKDGWMMVSADYSQIELRIMAHLAGDEALVQAFNAGEDIHSHTASMVFNLLPDFVTPEMRDRAKTVNFGVIYGMGPFGLASRLGLSLTEARDFIDLYFKTYPAVKAHIEATIAEAKEKGYVTTLLGRRRNLPEILSTNRQRREFAERTAVNTPVQGSASDMIKLAMIRVADRLQAENLQAKMVLQVHDELVFEVPNEEVDGVSAIAKEEMSSALDLKVPVEVEVGVGKNWLEAH